MKKILYVLLAIGIVGCAYSQGRYDRYRVYWRSFIKDPHFVDYKKERDDLEGLYLNKKLTYLEYIKQRDALDLKYDREVQERESIIAE